VLIDRFPELAEEIKKEYDWWKDEEPPPYCLFEGVLNSSGFMENLLFEETNIELIKRIFIMFEDMAVCEDVKVRTLLQVGLLEYLWGDHKLLTIAHKYMHPNTKRLCEELQPYFKTQFEPVKLSKRKSKRRKLI